MPPTLKAQAILSLGLLSNGLFVIAYSHYDFVRNSRVSGAWCAISLALIVWGVTLHHKAKRQQSA